MNCEVCRSIAFINYHIPVSEIDENEIGYSTVGFFDGMKTESIPMDFQKEDFKPLWEYSIKGMGGKQGHYSYQNIFVFGNDGWNGQSDSCFWSEERNKQYPLTFVVFLQLKDYETESRTIEKRCKEFSSAASKKLGEDGIVYSYYTVDKNDFVVCLKCVHYDRAVDTIKDLHKIEETVIYSYSVFSVSNKVLSELSEQNYPEIYGQKIASISLKGIANSINKSITLDHKYRDLCDRLVEQLYGEDVKNNRLYDILGDDDFRFIAREVNLGKLLCQFAKGGLLCYTERRFRFYLFSSSLVINTKTPKLADLGGELSESVINSDILASDQALQPKKCNELQQILDNIISSSNSDSDIMGREEEISYLYSIWQLLQSLKALETAPTKKYDFWSLYHPLSMLIQILSTKGDLSKSSRLHEFIHKISMTLHGTLRTDIQFFQIRDFNVIVHYAPAKLRAFYSLWAISVKNFYNALSHAYQERTSARYAGNEMHEYSFVFSPGMFKEVSVKQLYENYEEKRQLMLITSPERYLYLLHWTPLILAHEVSHFVGSCPRSRPARHEVWLLCSIRTLVLELERFRYDSIGRDATSYNLADHLEKAISETTLYNNLQKQMLDDEKTVRERECKLEHPFHSLNSQRIIMYTFRRTVQTDMEHLISGDSGTIQAKMKEELGFENFRVEERVNVSEFLRQITYGRDEAIKKFIEKFQSNWLGQLLDVYKYLTVESYADLMMVLSLELSPERYLRVFSDSTVMARFNEKTEKINNTMVVRIGLVIDAVEFVVQDTPEIWDDEFVRLWSGDVARNLVEQLQSSEAVCSLAAYVYKYLDRCRTNDHLKAIRHYEGVYNRRRREFSETRFDFLSDKIVWELLSGYMQTCARAYVQAMSADAEVGKMQDQLKGTYDAMTRGSIYDAVQEIENFLEKFEREAAI